MRAAELFCGAGGMTLGFERAGFTIQAAVEHDAQHVSIHRKNFPGCTVLEKDVRTVSGDDIRQLLDGKLDLLFGGPPCQGFSVGGLREQDDQRNELSLEFARLVRDLRPRYFVLENVQGMLTSGKNTLGRLRRSVRNSGYRIVEPVRVLNAIDFGVPQNRKRIFVLGYRIGEEVPSYPTALEDPSPTVWDAISDLPPVGTRTDYFHQDRSLDELGEPSEYAAMLRRPHRPLNPSPLSGCLRTRHSPEVKRRFAQTAAGEREPTSRFIRLDKGGVAPTLRAGTGRERGAFTAPRPIHPVEDRVITVREAARISSFPDSFEFYPNRWYGYSQVGNAVPPLLAEAVARSVLSAAMIGGSDDTKR